MPRQAINLGTVMAGYYLAILLDSSQSICLTALFFAAWLSLVRPLLVSGSGLAISTGLGTGPAAVVVFLQENHWWFSWQRVPHGHWKQENDCHK